MWGQTAASHIFPKPTFLICTIFAVACFLVPCHFTTKLAVPLRSAIWIDEGAGWGLGGYSGFGLLLCFVAMRVINRWKNIGGD